MAEYKFANIENQYKSVSDTELTQEEKEHYWATTSSGSQMKLLLTEPEMVGVDNPIFRAPAVKETLMWGNIQEDVIINEAERRYNRGIKIDKRTFISETFPFLTANIDGYIGVNADNVVEIIEIKNSRKDIDELLEIYKYQINYYMWFFRCREATLYALKNGNKLINGKLTRDDDLVEEMLRVAYEFNENGRVVSISMSQLMEQDITAPEEIDVLDEEIKTLIESVDEMEDNKAQAKALLKAKLFARHAEENKSSNKTVFKAQGARAIVSTVTRAGTTNWKAIAMDFMNGKNATEIKEIIAQNTSEGSTYHKLEIKKDGDSNE